MIRTFDEVISTRQRLREFINEPSRNVNNKVIDHIDDICRRFIAASPFVVLATRGGNDVLDLSPKGDPAGFVHVLDDKTLIIPERLGNNRVDSLENLLITPDAGLIFLIPGHGDTLRVSGRAQVVLDAALQDALSVKGKAPKLLISLTVERAYLHCPKSIMRSNLWKPDDWPDRSDVPSLAEAMILHGRIDDRTVSEMQAIIENDGRTRLY